jgi:ParB family chromosome partitioning protein
VIALPDGLTIAGHQRGKAARALGLRDGAGVACIHGRDRGRRDPMQPCVHNGTDLDDIDVPVHVPAGRAPGFNDVPAAAIRGDLRSRGAVTRGEIAQLVLRYGPWGCAVATHSGLVVSSPQYALACKMLRIPCRVYRIPDDKADVARGFFSRQYGAFSYDHLPRNTYLQTFAQMMRLRAGPSGKSNSSSLYDNCVIPKLAKSERLLDFGAGQCDYVKMLRRQGYRAHAVEFFHRSGQQIDTASVHRLIDDTLATLRKDGPFDVVVCDSVLNSVDTVQAEEDVLTCISALCRPGGRVYVSGRSREFEEHMVANTSMVMKKYVTRCYFMDEHGMSGAYRKGRWFYQKFHTKEQAVALAARFFGGAFTFQRHQSSSWQVSTVKAHELPADAVEASLRREFDLEWPEGRRVGRGDQAVAAWRAARARG